MGKARNPSVARQWRENMWFNRAQAEQREARARRLAVRIRENEQSAAAVDLYRLERERRAPIIEARRAAVRRQVQEAIQKVEERQAQARRGGRPAKPGKPTRIVKRRRKAA